MTPSRRRSVWRHRDGSLKPLSYAVITSSLAIMAIAIVGITLSATSGPGRTDTIAHYTPPAVEEEPATRPVRVALVGDSHLGSGKDYDGFDGGMAYQAGLLMGWDMVAHLGQGGTGYVTAPEGKTTFGERIEEIVSANPDLVYIQGGNNDPWDEVGPAATAFYDALKARLPGVQLVVVGPVITSDPIVERGDLKLRDNLQAAALSAGATYIDPVAGQWITGPERSTDRADAKYIGPDGVHLNLAGVHYMADKLHGALVAAGVPSETHAD